MSVELLHVVAKDCGGFFKPFFNYKPNSSHWFLNTHDSDIYKTLYFYFLFYNYCLHRFMPPGTHRSAQTKQS